jgi:hypothetical protein
VGVAFNLVAYMGNIGATMLLAIVESAINNPNSIMFGRGGEKALSSELSI